MGHKTRNQLTAPLTSTVTAIIMLLLAGCSVQSRYAHPALVSQGKRSLAVLPFENLSNHTGAGLIATQLLRTLLYKSEQFTLQKELVTRHFFKKQKIDLSQLADNYLASKLGELLGVELVMVGSVSEYGYQNGLGQEAAVGFNARLVAVNSGLVIWAGSYSKVGSGIIFRTSLNNTAHELARVMIEELVESMQKKEKEVLEPSDTHIEPDIGLTKEQKPVIMP